MHPLTIEVTYLEAAVIILALFTLGAITHWLTSSKPKVPPTPLHRALCADRMSDHRNDIRDLAQNSYTAGYLAGKSKQP